MNFSLTDEGRNTNKLSIYTDAKESLVPGDQ